MSRTGRSTSLKAVCWSRQSVSICSEEERPSRVKHEVSEARASGRANVIWLNAALPDCRASDTFRFRGYMLSLTYARTDYSRPFLSTAARKSLDGNHRTATERRAVSRLERTDLL